MLIYVLEESVHEALCVVTAQLHEESSVVIYVTISTPTDHTPPYPRLLLTVCAKRMWGGNSSVVKCPLPIWKVECSIHSH